MTIGVLKSESLVAITKEITQNVPVDPTVSDDYVQVLEDGFSFTPTKEVIERNTITPSIGTNPSRTSIRSFTASIPVEWNTSGVEGQAPPSGVLLEAALGGVSSQAAKTTTSLGTIDTVNITAHGYLVGDFIVIKIPGNFHACFVKEVVDANSIKIFPNAPIAVANGVSVSASKTYYPTNSGQPTLTTTLYWGDDIKEQGSGARVASLAIENFTVGQTPNLNFSLQGLSYDRIDGSSPVTPVYNENLPPVVLGATLADQDGNCIDLQEFAFTMENTVANLNSICPVGGILNSRYTKRAVSGTFNPYIDDTTVKWFNIFKNDTIFSLSLTLGVHSSISGELVAGSVVGIYMPVVQITETPIGDVDGVLVDQVSYQAHTAVDGTGKQVFFGFS